MPHRKGQSSTEALLLLPLFLTMAFGLIQIGLIGVALVTTTYGAGSIARKAVSDDIRSFSPGAYEPRLKSLLFGGMEVQGLSGRLTLEGPQLYTVTVNACTKVMALPVIGYFLKQTLQDSLRFSGACREDTPPVTFMNEPPYGFVVQGSARARMNYRSQ